MTPSFNETPLTAESSGFVKASPSPSSPSVSSTDSAPPSDLLQLHKMHPTTEPASPETAASLSASSEEEDDDDGIAIMGNAPPSSEHFPTHNHLSTNDLILSAPTPPMALMDQQQQHLQQNAPPAFPPPKPDPIPPPRSSMHTQVYEEAFTILDEVDDNLPVTSKRVSSDIFADEEDDDNDQSPQKSPLVSASKGSWSLFRIPRTLKQATVALGVVAILFLIIALLFGDDSHETTPVVANADESVSEDPSTSNTTIITPNNPIAGEVETASYVVQWGIQTAGCSYLTWPTLELSCGSHANAAVHVIDARISIPASDTGYTPTLDCAQKDGNLVYCNINNYDVSDSQGDDLLYGTVLATCVRKESSDGDGVVPTFANGLELTAHIPIGTYAEDCRALLQNTTLDDTQVFHRHGGHSMPWLTMARFCRSEGQRLLRRTSAEELDVQMDVFMCGQGDHSEGDRLRQSYCYHQEDCATIQVCNSPEICAGEPTCDIPSGTIRSDTVDLATGGETDPQCIFERVLHTTDMWSAFEEHVQGAPPALDPNGTP